MRTGETSRVYVRTSGSDLGEMATLHAVEH
jgi:hypothetical protein